MFGYRLVHKDVLAWLMARAGGEPAPVTYTTTSGVTLQPTYPELVRDSVPAAREPDPEPMPAQVVSAIEAWDANEHARLTLVASDLLDSGMDARQVAAIIAAGEPVTD